MATEKKVAGVIGFFDDPESLLAAARKTRDSEFRQFDVFSPYPIHGMDEAQGLKRSKVPVVAFFFGMTGCLLGFSFQYWTMAVDWPHIIGGKPFNSWPAFVPVMFELTILFAGLSTAGSMFLFNRLPNVRQRSFDPAITRDRFALVIDAPASETAATEFVRTLGARDVRTVFAEGWF